jgi:uncharacterized RDD family membrane protein YckC
MIEQVKIETAHNVTIRYEPASVGDRMIATLIDNILAYGIALAIIFLTDFMPNDSDFGYYVRLFMIFTAVIIFLFYHLFMEIFTNGQSVGKRIRKIKIIRLDGAEPRLGNYLIRWLLRVIDTFIMGLPAILTIAINGKGQRLGDMAGGTTVVKLNLPIQLDEVIAYVQSHQTYQVSYPQVIQLSDNDINIIKDTLRNYRQTRNSKLVNTLADKVKTLLKIQNFEPPAIFLETIIKDHSFLIAKQEGEVYSA